MEPITVDIDDGEEIPMACEVLVAVVFMPG